MFLQWPLVRPADAELVAWCVARAQAIAATAEGLFIPSFGPVAAVAGGAELAAFLAGEEPAEAPANLSVLLRARNDLVRAHLRSLPARFLRLLRERHPTADRCLSFVNSILPGLFHLPETRPPPQCLVACLTDPPPVDRAADGELSHWVHSFLDPQFIDPAVLREYSDPTLHPKAFLREDLQERNQAVQHYVVGLTRAEFDRVCPSYPLVGPVVSCLNRLLPSALEPMFRRRGQLAVCASATVPSAFLVADLSLRVLDCELVAWFIEYARQLSLQSGSRLWFPVFGPVTAVEGGAELAAYLADPAAPASPPNLSVLLLARNLLMSAHLRGLPPGVVKICRDRCPTADYCIEYINTVLPGLFHLPLTRRVPPCLFIRLNRGNPAVDRLEDATLQAHVFSVLTTGGSSILPPP